MDTGFHLEDLPSLMGERESKEPVLTACLDADDDNEQLKKFLLSNNYELLYSFYFS